MMRLLLSLLALISGLSLEARAAAAPVPQVGVVRMVGAPRAVAPRREVAPGLAMVPPAPPVASRAPAPLATLPAAPVAVVLKVDRARE